MYDETMNEGVGFSPLPFPEDFDGQTDPQVEGDDDQTTELPDNVVAFPGVEEPEEEEIVDFTVEYGDRVFQIEEPDAGTIVRVLNFVGVLATRAEGYKSRNFQGAMRAASEGNYDLLRAELYSFASTLTINDLISLSAIVFFGGGRDREKQGNEFFTKLYTDNPRALKIAPLVKAIGYSLELSEDLREAMGNLALVRWSSPKTKVNRKSRG